MKNTEADISSRKESKKFENCGGRGKKILGLEGLLLLGGQYRITCHGFFK